MPKFVFMPPQDDLKAMFAARLADTMPEYDLPNVLITPHVAVADAENIPERRFQIILDNARRFLNDEPLANVVDKERWY